MDLATARLQIEASLNRMASLYGQPVFDEWIILASGTKKVGALAYFGPRETGFRAELAADVQPLITQAAGQSLDVGDFDFTAQGSGTKYDALLKLADMTYLVCNNTTKSMAEIRTDGQWLKAQSAFFELSEKFRHDPLVIAGGATQ